MTPDEAQRIAQEVYARYHRVYHGEVQGCCALLAREVATRTGGVPVAGYLTWYSGSCRRAHWWVEHAGVVLDPMGDDFLRCEAAPGRVEVHRDAEELDEAVDYARRWYVPQ